MPNTPIANTMDVSEAAIEYESDEFPCIPQQQDIPNTSDPMPLDSQIRSIVENGDLLLVKRCAVGEPSIPAISAKSNSPEKHHQRNHTHMTRARVRINRNGISKKVVGSI